MSMSLKLPFMFFFKFTLSVSSYLEVFHPCHSIFRDSRSFLSFSSPATWVIPVLHWQPRFKDNDSGPELKDGSVGKMFDTKTWEHEFYPQKPCQKSLVLPHMFVTLILERWQEKEHWGLVFIQYRLLAILQARKRPCLKKRMVSDVKIMMPKVDPRSLCTSSKTHTWKVTNFDFLIT